MKPTVEPLDRVVPGHSPGAITSIARRLPGETGTDALERIGKAVMPASTGTGLTPAKRSPGRPKSLPRQIAAIIAMRTEGMKDQEIADKLDLSIGTIRAYLYKARKSLMLADVMPNLEHRAVPTAVDNLIEGLDRGDKDYTLKTLEGVGLFRKHQAIQAQTSSENTNVLRVVFEMPEIPVNAPVIAVGSISGSPHRPKVIEGEVSHGDGG